jgi:NADH-dependent peroxiredoxin subunit F
MTQPERTTQEIAMLDSNLTTQLRTYLAHLRHPIELIASLDDGEKSRELRELLHEIAALSSLISVREDGADARKPSFAIARAGEQSGVRFAGIPLGHEFTSLVLALLHVGGHPPKADADAHQADSRHRRRTTAALRDLHIALVPQLPGRGAGLEPDGGPEPEHRARDDRRRLVPERSGRAQDHGGAGGLPQRPGVRPRPHDAGGNRRQGRCRRCPRSEKLDAQAPYDVLVVGGGPAGASAAIYAARKGIRTGIVAERFGGQVMDTMGIENLISVPHTEGPKLVAALEQHVKEYDVDIMNMQRAEALVPPGADGLAAASKSALRTARRCERNRSCSPPVRAGAR